MTKPIRALFSKAGTMIPEQIAESRKICKAAKPGPWKEIPISRQTLRIMPPEKAYILDACNNYPKAMDEIERLNKSYELVRQAFNRCYAEQEGVV